MGISFARWSELGCCPADVLADRLTHAALSADGRFCFLGAVDDEAYGVWDIRNSELLWVEDDTVPGEGPPDLRDWLREGFLQLDVPQVRGRYRVFGLLYDHSLHATKQYQLRLAPQAQEVLIVHRDTGVLLQRLPYRAASGDWVRASFAEMGDVLAVLEPYFVTFFRLSAAREADV